MHRGDREFFCKFTKIMKIERETALVFPEQNCIRFQLNFVRTCFVTFPKVRSSCVDVARANLRVPYKLEYNSLAREIGKQKIPA